jgi:hypothetical protein
MLLCPGVLDSQIFLHWNIYLKEIAIGSKKWDAKMYLMRKLKVV